MSFGSVFNYNDTSMNMLQHEDQQSAKTLNAAKQTFKETLQLNVLVWRLADCRNFSEAVKLIYTATV